MPTSLADNDLKKELDRINWDFPGVQAGILSPHGLHYFPGNIIPEIPRVFLKLLSSPGDVVLDPFCGSGTVAFEASLLGRRAIQSDVCRASANVASGKAALLAVYPSAERIREHERQLVWDSLLQTSEPGKLGEGTDPELFRWFHPVTLAELRYLWKRVEDEGDEGVSQLLRLLFTDVLFACASTRSSKTRSGLVRHHHWGWVADNVRPKELCQHSALDYFRARLRTVERTLPLFATTLPMPVTIVADCRNLAMRSQGVDLIVTSPPYVNMIDYTLANRLSYLWFGWRVDGEVEREIGARRRRSRSGSLDEYLTAMKIAWTEQFRVLRPGGYCAVVLGAARGKQSTAMSAFQLSVEAGFEIFWGPTMRVPRRRRVSDRRGSEQGEFVCVLRKSQ